MNTPAHLIVGIAAFGKSNRSLITLAALVGASIPDLSLYLLAGHAMFVLGTSPEIVFGTLYFSDSWQQVFAVDNSFVLWGGALLVALWYKSAWAIALCGAALLHILADFPLHSEDARMHFWPISEWRFYSPLSYWDSSRGALWLGPLELIIVLASAVWIFRKIRDLWVRGLTLLLAGLQIWTFANWYLYF